MDNEEHIRRLVERLRSEEGRASMKKAAEDSLARAREREEAARIKDPLFWFRRVTI